MTRAMADDSAVIVMGEDVGVAGGIFRTTQGLQQQFGEDRVIDTPLDEKGILAHAIGMALYGLRPIAEIQFSGFIHDAFEQIMFCGSKYRWITGGQYTCPMVVRAPSFGGIKGGFWHSQSPEAYFIHGGGMKVVCPATPDDAYRLLLAAIADPDPVLVLEPVPLYRSLSGPVDDDGVPAEIGRAAVVRPGDDLTIVAYGPPRHLAPSRRGGDGRPGGVLDRSNRPAVTRAMGSRDGVGVSSTHWPPRSTARGLADTRIRCRDCRGDPGARFRVFAQSDSADCWPRHALRLQHRRRVLSAEHRADTRCGASIDGIRVLMFEFSTSRRRRRYPRSRTRGVDGPYRLRHRGGHTDRSRQH